ncbi:MAG: hypothetical protein M3N68_08580 [Actinomycetota bacterium]|nr:hypothetical protein [Actinomycetota bacterium]
MRPQALPEGVLTHQPLQLADQLCVPSESQVGLSQSLGRRQPELLKPDRFRDGPRLVCEVGHRRPTPEVKRSDQKARRLFWVVLVERGLAFTHQRNEPVHVVGVRVGDQDVSG